MVASTEAVSRNSGNSSRPVKPATVRNNKATASSTTTNAASAAPCEGQLKEYVANCMQRYFSTLNGHQPTNLYDMVIADIEAPLLEATLDYCEGNQSRAAELLGLNRGTLRKKLRSHDLTA